MNPLNVMAISIMKSVIFKILALIIVFLVLSNLLLDHGVVLG